MTAKQFFALCVMLSIFAGSAKVVTNNLTVLHDPGYHAESDFTDAG